MEKIKLLDQTELDIMNGATINSIQMPYENLTDVTITAEKLTEDNLSEYRILNEAGLTCTTQYNKYVSLIQIDPVNKVVTFILSDVDIVVKRLTALEENQEIQAGAIVELAEMASVEEEGK